LAHAALARAHGRGRITLYGFDLIETLGDAITEIGAGNVRTQANKCALASTETNTRIGNAFACGSPDGSHVARQNRGQKCSLGIAPFDLPASLSNKTCVRNSWAADHN
jgi:hypothetical protein